MNSRRRISLCSWACSRDSIQPIALFRVRGYSHLGICCCIAWARLCLEYPIDSIHAKRYKCPLKQEACSYCTNLYRESQFGGHAQDMHVIEFNTTYSIAMSRIQ